MSRMLIDSETVSRRANVSSAAVSGDSARWATGWAARSKRPCPVPATATATASLSWPREMLDARGRAHWIRNRLLPYGRWVSGRYPRSEIYMRMHQLPSPAASGITLSRCPRPSASRGFKPSSVPSGDSRKASSAQPWVVRSALDSSGTAGQMAGSNSHSGGRKPLLVWVSSTARPFAIQASALRREVPTWSVRQPVGCLQPALPDAASGSAYARSLISIDGNLGSGTPRQP